MIGQLIGNYKIEAKLGEGGMGAVYRGVDTMLDREVAIKALRPELASQTSIVERFRTEAVTLAKLNHPNIATLYSMFRQGDELYMVLEFVRGATLESIMRDRGAIPAEEAIPVFCQVLDGIDHAHELGIVHRDIKPANMMFTEKGTLKVLDFGIARLLGSARMTRAGNIIGTLEYMAPEQVKGLETDGRSDIYALGMMLYELLTGQLPFQTENEFALMKSQTEEIPRRPREINPAITEEVEAAIMRAVQKNPDDRFQTGGDFRSSLLDAGFAANGALRGFNASHRNSTTQPSNPPISHGVATRPPPENGGSPIKGTRLGGDVPITPPSQADMHAFTTAEHASADRLKATRVGAARPILAANPAISENVASESFFSKLTAVHYAGAGAVVLLLVGALVAIPVIFFVATSTGGTANANKTGAAPTAIKSATPAPPPVLVQQPVASENPESVQATPMPTPLVTDPPPSLVEDRSAPSERAKPAAPVTRKTPTIVKKKEKSREQKLAEARCALTDDC